MSPVAMPTLPGFIRARFGLRTNTQRFESPISRDVQTVELLGARWFATFEPPELVPDEAGEWKAFLIDVGGAGRFIAFDPARTTPRGTGSGSPLVKGSGQSGIEIDTDGWAANEAVLLKGDYFSIGGELKMVTVDVMSDGAGNATLRYRPALRASPADDAPITVDNPTCVMRFIDDEQAVWDEARTLTRLQFSAIEVW
ncbi:MAG: hypothetical protein AB7P52_17820 [Alphaproteobacteria bacterium]